MVLWDWWALWDFFNFPDIKVLTPHKWVGSPKNEQTNVVVRLLKTGLI